MRRLLIGVVVLVLGCAAAREEAPSPAEERDRPDGVLRPGRGATPEPPPPGEQTVHSPHDAVPGGPDETPAEELRVRFREPAEPPRPIALERRPGLPEQVELSVASVRDGLLRPAEALILRVDAELSSEEEIAVVTGPGGQPDGPEVDLAGLARIAGQARHHLLLVDVRPSRRESGLRDGYLLHAPTGALLAAWTVTEGGPPPRSPGMPADDLVARIARAHQRIGAE